MKNKFKDLFLLLINGLKYLIIIFGEYVVI